MYKFIDGQRIQMTQEEIDAYNADLAVRIAQRDADAAKEVARQSKRPKRSDINATKASVQSAQSVADLRTAVANLMQLMDNILVFQRVDVDEDV